MKKQSEEVVEKRTWHIKKIEEMELFRVTYGGAGHMYRVLMTRGVRKDSS